MYTKFCSTIVIVKHIILFYSKTNWGAQGRGAFFAGIYGRAASDDESLAWFRGNSRT